MKIVCLDLEGVLIPEFWEEFSKKTKIPELMKTTRDEPNYDKLMKMRIKILKKNKFGLKEINKIVSKMKPFKKAPEFIKWLCKRAQPVILTGSYYDYIMPLMKKLNYPFLIANTLKIAPNGEIIGYKLREKDGKIEMVRRFQKAGYEVIAIGDSFNDVKMLEGANKGILFKATQKLIEEKKEMIHAEKFEELKKILQKIL
ncbi:MAG: bifunctional phosphoserine phosphatase/homoserine phosphotransferase ThrH [Candidatus ainarchaeum sp.]|nr:bifunctional phosphoserine phosphatase/homoserine phosphotransferase ThrH [Candidatus ainarchaeum sp.]